MAPAPTAPDISIPKPLSARGAAALSMLVGAIFSALASLATVHANLGDAADLPTPITALWLSGTGLGSLGMLSLVSRDPHGRSDGNAIIDTAIVAAIGLTAAWQLLVSPRYHAEKGDLSTTELVLLGAVPVLLIAPLAVVCHAVVSERRRAALGYLLIMGAAAWVAFDIVLLGRSHAWATSRPASQVLSVAGSAAIALAAVHLRANTAVRPQEVEVGDARRPADSSVLGDMLADAGFVDPGQLPGEAGDEASGTEVERFIIDDEWRSTLTRVSLTLVPLALPSIVEGIRYAWRGPGTPIPALVATIVIAALTVIRLARQFQTHRARRAELEANQQYFRALIASSADAVVIVDRAGRIVKGSPNLVALLGTHRGGPGRSGAFPGADLSLLVSASSTDVIDLIEQAAAKPGQVVSAELHVEHADGQQLWLSARAVNLIDDRSVGGIIVNLHDITNRKNTEQELERLAFHDVLTGLANRALFRDRLEHAIQRSTRTRLAPAIIYLDVDGFKKVNDSLGHEAGDELLQEIARRVGAAVRGGDTVARLGGDEFAVLVEYSSKPAEEAGAICDRILEGLEQPITLDDQTVTVSASLGIAVGEPGLTASSVLRHADIAMYRAKAEGKSRWMVYEPEMSHGLVHRMRIESDLVAVLERDELELLYQPVVKLGSGRLVGFEALLRWNHPSLGVLVPAEFMPIAEETGAIVPIGRWALATACKAAATWTERLRVPPEFTVGVNLSARQLAETDLVSTVREVLSESGLDASALILEMSESALGDATGAARQLPEIRELGVHVALDDFGIGGSPLAHLQRLPIDFLKIDRTFIHTVGDFEKIPPMVEGLIELGRRLGLTLLAEGIEHEAQREVLARAGCELGQGHLFSAPVGSAAAEELIARAAAAAGEARRDPEIAHPRPAFKPGASVAWQ